MTTSISNMRSHVDLPSALAGKRNGISGGPTSAVSVFILFLLLWGWSFGNPAYASIVNEPMTGATAPGWVIGGSAYLSASTGVDPVGDGWLRLTEPLNDQAGFAFFDSPFDISQGVVISFDYATWGGNGADGYSVFLFDGSYDASTFSVGASGGSLGYDKKTVAPVHAGLSGGYIGVGIDEYGNFSNPTEGRLGGPGQQPNEVGVRGPYNHPSGAYYWLGGSGTLATQLAFNNQLYRPIQTGVQYRKVVINLTPVAAPNYLRIDTYVQFGYNQPLTPVITGLFTGRPIPASAKIGYAASTGGSTNYHEIRDLVIDPLQTDIDLAVTKTVSSPSVTQGGTVIYTVTARNYGPANTTATNAPITDTIPALLTGATWTCAGAGGGTCGAASGAGNITTTATLPFNGSVSYTIRSTVTATAALGSTITNTATLTPPAGITDYAPANNSASIDVQVTGPPVTLTGTIYSDANHNGMLDGGEGSPGIATIYAKLFRTSNMTTALQAVAYNAGTGAYTFTNVPSYDDYTIILSTNNTLTDPTPIDPNANWIFTSPESYTLENISVAGANVTGLNFGLYNGSRISGKVINDNGLNGAPANANDGVLNAAETGIPGVTVSLRNTTGGTTYDTVTTDSNGNFDLYTNTPSATLRIYEANLATYVSVTANVGNTAGTYTMAGEYISFAYTRYANNATGGYRNVIFSDVPDNTFTPTPQAQNGMFGQTVYFGHTLLPGSSGTVSFSLSSRATAPAAPVWPAVVYYRDVNCNGTYDGGDTVLAGSVAASAGTPLCILVQDTIPGTATLGTTDQLVTRATFTYVNSIGPVVRAYNVTDTTTVAAAGSVTVSGTVYNDANHNGVPDGGEASPAVAGIYAKLFRSSSLTSALSVTAVSTATGAYSFYPVPPNDTYTIILSSTSTTAYDPSFPNTQWVYTSPANYVLSAISVGGTNLANQNFGVFNGTRIDGQVLKDDGAAVPANANNGVRNAGESGIAGQSMSICDNASCTAIDTEVTDATGSYSLFIPWTTNFTTARVTQTSMPAGFSMVSYNPGTAAGSAVNLASRFITFTFTRGSDITGLVHSDVPDNSFTPTPLAQTGSQTAQLYYAHTFAPGTGGTVSFAPALRSQATWSTVAYYQDVNCNGAYDGGDVVLPASVNTVAGTPLCILVKDTVLATAPTGTTDQIVTRATFTFTNSSGPLVQTYDVSDTTTVQTPNLTTSTKTWVDLNGGGVNAGDILQYTITIINSTATVTAYGVGVTDDIPANVNSFSVVSFPAGATDSSTGTGTGSNGTGYLNISNISVPPGGSETVVFNVFINSAAVSGTVISNTAAITQPGGPGDAPAAPNATVVAVTGNKPLYLYSAPTYTLSRTPPVGAPAAVTIGTNASQTWTQLPVAAGNMTIDPAVGNVVPVILQAVRSGSAGNISLTVSLQCSSGGTVLSLGPQNCAAGNPAPQTCTYNLPLAAPLTCAAGNSWRLTIQNNSGTRTLTVYPVSGGIYSRVVLPATTVINVNSVTAYNAPYPALTTPASGYFSGGDTVYLRAVVSDPFGSYDINASPPATLPQITLRDASSTSLFTSAMTQVADSGSLTKTFEYVYTPVPAAGPAGTWTASVTATEGTENNVSASGIGTFRVVLLPGITMLKSVLTYADPFNSTTNPKSIPGAIMLYTITLSNTGRGSADNVTVTDPIPANTDLFVGDIAGAGSGPVLFTDGPSLSPASPASGLSYAYGGLGNSSDSIAFFDSLGNSMTPVPDANGFDANVRSIQVTPAGSFNASGGISNPAFSLKFRVRIR